ncbi:MAG: hypothetical protein ACOYN0_03605 [Phycisphaerales bacterium]
MSVRVCYLLRGPRGRELTGLRLLGQGFDESWRASGPQSGVYEAGAQWLRDKLADSRSATSLTLLCLDPEGAVCSSVHAPSVDDDVVAALARDGAHSSLDQADDGASRSAPSPALYLAGDGAEATVQALVEAAPTEPKPSLLPTRTQPSTKPRRVPVLAASDVPAKLLVDALDADGVTVERSCTVWHAMATAWDRRTRSDEPESARVLGVVCLAPGPEAGGRLIWSWSRGGALIAGGSMRVGLTRPATEASLTDGAISLPDAAPTPNLGGPELGRLIAEWLSWSAQTGEAPERIVCVLPELAVTEAGLPGAPAFAQALTAAWKGATLDLITDPDPMGLTLRRTAESLDTSAPGAMSPGKALVTLSSRPGRAHRRMYVWGSLAIVGAAAAMGIIAWRLNAEASAKKAAAGAWRNNWREMLREKFPQSVAPPLPGDPPKGSPLQQVRDEIARLQDLRAPADRPEATMPVLQELDSLSLLLGNPDYRVESLELDSVKDVRLNLQVNSLEEAEQLLASLKELGGLNTQEWEARYPSGAARPDPSQKIKMTYIGRWNPELRKQPRGGT